MISFPVAGVREDVFLIWKELEEARSTVRQIQKIVSESDQPASRDGIIYVSFNRVTFISMINVFFVNGFDHMTFWEWFSQKHLCIAPLLSI